MPRSAPDGKRIHHIKHGHIDHILERLDVQRCVVAAWVHVGQHVARDNLNAHLQCRSSMAMELPTFLEEPYCWSRRMQAHRQALDIAHGRSVARRWLIAARPAPSSP